MRRLRSWAERFVGPRATTPPSAYSGSIDSVNARILAKIVPVVAAAALAGGGVYAFGASSHPAAAAALCAMAAALMFAREIARRGRWQAALWTVFVSFVVAAVIATVAVGTTDRGAALSFAVWLLIPVLITMCFAPSRAVVVAGVVVTAATFLTLAGLGAWGAALVEPCVLVGTTSALSTFLVYHREELERMRQSALTAHNEELRRLHHELERRVAEKTVAVNEARRAADDLARTNVLLEQNHRTMLTQERMAAIGRLTAGIAHEISSPIATLRAAVDELDALVSEYDSSTGDASVTDEDHREIAREMKESLRLARVAGERAANFIRSVRAQTRSTELRRERFDVVEVVKESLTLLGHAANAGKCRLVMDAGVAPHAGKMEGVPGRLAQAVTNLVQNAIDATAERGGGEVRVGVRESERGIRIDVSDEGGGIPEAVRPHIFEPLFTTKPFGKGTGLGLSIVREVVEKDFAGAIEVACEEGEGKTVFSVELPRGVGVIRA